MASPTKKPLEISLPRALFKAGRASPAPLRVTDTDSLIPNRDAALDLISDLSQVRHLRNRTEMLRYLAQHEGPVSTATHNFVQVANNGYKIRAYDVGTNAFSSEGTNLAQGVMARFDTLYDYSDGYSDKMTTETLLETMLRECVLTQTAAAELVLNAALQPESITVVPAETLRWRNRGKGKGVYPQQIQYNTREPVDLDIPTFFVQRMANDPGTLYPKSMLESAVKLLVYFEEFMDDVRRVVRQSGHARQTVTLDTEKAIKTAPASVRNDPKKLQEWLIAIQSEVQATLDAISPEDAIILFDTAVYDIKSPSFGNKIDYTPMLTMIAGMSAMSMKSPPSALGMRLDSSANEASVETLIFQKSAKAIQTPVEGVMSRALTLGVRLLGANVYVRFDFDPIDLRPEMELESFVTMKQTRILEQLSYGFIGDDEAAIEMGCWPRPVGAPKLSGTMFELNKGQNPNLPVTPGDTPVGKAQQPNKDAPRKAGGASQ